MKHCFSILFFFILSSSVISQELNCNVIINAERAQTQEQQIFDDLKTVVTDFLNNRRWTDDEFKTEERINCNLLINVISVSNLTRFTCNAQIQVSRPIYGVDYESPVLSVVDKDFNFVYNEGQNVIFNENVYSSNLTSLLAFYAYIILAIDYDSFAPKAGAPYIEKAFNIVNNAQGASERGWKQFDGPNNRYALIDQLNNTQFIPFRLGLYNYHRKAMDEFTKNPKDSREIILKLFGDIKNIRTLQPISFLLESYFMAKSSEITDIFSVGSKEEKQKAFELLRRIDPTNTQRYEKILTTQ